MEKTKQVVGKAKGTATAKKRAPAKKPAPFPWALYAGKNKLNPGFGVAVRIRCFEMGLWRGAVCEAACLSPATMSTCEAGYLPGPAELRRLADAVGLTPRELLVAPTIRYG